MIRRFAVAVALTLAPAAFAQTYIVPEGDCGEVTFHATRGAEFPALGETIAADEVTNAYLVVPGKRTAMQPSAAPHSLDFHGAVPEQGVTMAGVDFAPTVVGNETRTDHAKAMTFCGATPAYDWQHSVGLGLEVFPQGWNGPRPRMKPGDVMWFIAVDKATNKLLQNPPMELYREGEGRISTGVPNRIGGADFKYGKPGLYMVKATYRRPDPNQPEHWLVDTSTLTFRIK